MKLKLTILIGLIAASNCSLLEDSISAINSISDRVDKVVNDFTHADNDDGPPHQESLIKSAADVAVNVINGLKYRLDEFTNGVESPYIEDAEHLVTSVANQIAVTIGDVTEGMAKEYINRATQKLDAFLHPNIKHARMKRGILSGLTGAVTGGITSGVGSTLGGVTNVVGGTVGKVGGAVTGVAGGALGSVLGGVLGGIPGLNLLMPLLNLIPMITALIPTIIKTIQTTFPNTIRLFSRLDEIPQLLTTAITYILNINPRALLIQLLQGTLTLPGDILTPLISRQIRNLLVLSIGFSLAYIAFAIFILTFVLN